MSDGLGLVEGVVVLFVFKGSSLTGGTEVGLRRRSDVGMGGLAEKG